jgi:PAS domain S-box-containing protein
VTPPRRLRWTLATRLSAAVLALSLCSVALVSWLSYSRAEEALRRSLLDRLRTFAIKDANSLERWVARQQAALELQARALERAGDADAKPLLDRPLTPIDAQLLTFEELQLVAVPGGRVVQSTLPASVGTYVVDEAYYREGRHGPMRQPIHPSSVTGRPRLTVATPVTDVRGDTVAVLAAHLDLGTVEALLQRPSTDVPLDGYLVNRYAEFVSAQRFGVEGHARGVHSLGIDSVLTGASGIGAYPDYAGRPVLGAWQWVPALEIGLIVEAPEAAALAPARRLLFQTLGVGIAVAFLLAVGVVVVTRRNTRPVLAVAEAASAVAAGRFDVTAIADSGSDEVGELARAFNVMTARLRTLYDDLGAQVRATQDALADAETSRALLQDVVDNAGVLVCVVDADDRLLLANRRFAELAGTPREAVTGRRLAELPSSAFTATIGDAVRAARETQRVDERELSLGSSGTGAHAWQVVTFPLRKHDGTTYAAGLVATDLTERARAEAARRAQDASVQQAQRLESLGVMAGGIAHDFNNLLGAILGNVDLARDAAEDPAEVRVALEQIAAASRRAAELTRQMLAYAGRASLRREVVDVRAVVEDLVPLVRAAHSKKVQFAVTLSAEPLWVDCDPAQLSQVVLNLLTNAAEAIGDEIGTVTVRGELVAADDVAVRGVPTVRLRVEDTGRGIDPEIQARIFDPFFTTKTAGRGLGLSAVRGIVQSLGGWLALASAPGAGTQFDILLPAAPAPVQATDAAATAPASVARRHTVLIVDDEAPIRHVLRRTLARMGVAVLEAEDGPTGVALLAAHADEVSLVILDQTMPGMSGSEVLATLRGTHPVLPVLLASGYDRSDALTDIAGDANVRFLQKPFGVQSLEDAVAELLTTAPAPSRARPSSSAPPTAPPAGPASS